MGTGLRYDAAIIGAGADGLAAAATLGRSGLKAVIIERNEHPGGRCMLREFHPGFRAAPFVDELAPVPPQIAWDLDLARRGAVFIPAPVSSGLWPDRAKMVRSSELARLSNGLVHQALERAEQDVAPKPRPVPWLGSAREPTPWPGDALALRSLEAQVREIIGDETAASVAIAGALCGRAAHPALAGSSLHLLVPGGSGLVVGGLSKLADALVSAAQDAGAELRCGSEVTDIRCSDSKTCGVTLADGTEIEARGVISTLDLKRTFLSLFEWNALPKGLANHAATFRMAGSTARLLLALESLPEPSAFATANLFRGPIHIAPAADDFAAAYSAWRAGTLAERLPLTLRFVSVTDPSLAPIGSATMTVTAGAVPARLFDGAWTHEKREALRQRMLASIEYVLPGSRAHVLASELIVPPDIEDALGLTEGDLWGGEIAADQMLALRPWLDCAAPRTPIGGFYLAGPSTTAGVLSTCGAGVLAAQALAADLAAGRLK